MSLQQIIGILLARKWMMLITIGAVLVTATIVTNLLPPRYVATSSIVIDFKAPDPVLGNYMPSAMLAGAGYIATQLDIIASRNVALKAVDSLKLADTPEAKEAFEKATEGQGSIRDWLADLLLNSLKLEPSRESSMVNINFRSTDPQFAAAAANAFVQAYINTNLELKVEPARQTSAFFDSQLQVLKANLESAQRKLSAVQREKGITATDERFDVENAKLSELSSQVLGAQSQTFESLSRRKQVNDAMARGASPDTLSDVLNNPLIQTLKNQLTQAEGRLYAVSSRIGTEHPQYQAAVKEVEELKQRLADEMKTVARSVNTTSTVASQREGALQGALITQKARVMEIKKQRDEASVLIREVENAQRAYDVAMTRYMQTSLESRITQTNIAVVNPAIVPLKPAFPKLPLNLALAFVVGSILAVGLALVAEFMDRTARCEEDLVAALGVPVIGCLGPLPRRSSLRSLPLVSRLLGAPAPGS